MGGRVMPNPWRHGAAPHREQWAEYPSRNCQQIFASDVGDLGVDVDETKEDLGIEQNVQTSKVLLSKHQPQVLGVSVCRFPGSRQRPAAET